MPAESSKILVDTSVFIDFFRGLYLEPFESLMRQNRVLLSRYVRLELLQGVREKELGKLDYVLGGLEVIVPREDLFQEAEAVLFRVKGSGLTMGIVDLMIAAEARFFRCAIYSKDRVFERLAAMKLVPGLWE